MLPQVMNQPLAPSERQRSQEEDHAHRAAVSGHLNNDHKAVADSRKATQASEVMPGSDRRIVAVVGLKAAVDSALKVAVVGHTRAAVAADGPKVVAADGPKAAVVDGPKAATTATRAATIATRTAVALATRAAVVGLKVGTRL